MGNRILSHIQIYGLFILQILLFTTIFIVMNTLYWTIPKLYYHAADLIGYYSRVSRVVRNTHDYADYLVTWSAYKVVMYSMYSVTKMQVEIRGPPFDTLVTDLNTGETKHLLSYCKRNNRPLVLNFGSVSCTIFRSFIEEFNALVERRNRDVDFLMVYIFEGHAEDEWKFGKAPHTIYQHRTVGERLRAAAILREDYGMECDIVVDNMENSACLAYGADPMRLFVISNGEVVYVGDQGPFGYSIESLEKFLDSNF